MANDTEVVTALASDLAKEMFRGIRGIMQASSDGKNCSFTARWNFEKRKGGVMVTMKTSVNVPGDTIEPVKRMLRVADDGQLEMWNG